MREGERGGREERERERESVKDRERERDFLPLAFELKRKSRRVKDMGLEWCLPAVLGKVERKMESRRK